MVKETFHICWQVLKPYFEPLNEQQRADIHKLQQSSRQAEDALTQGMEKLHQNLSLSIASDPIGSYISQMGDGMEKLEALESFVSQVKAHSFTINGVHCFLFQLCSHICLFYIFVWSYPLFHDKSRKI